MRFPTRQLRQLSRADEGQALVLTALALVVLMLMVGLGIDVAFLRYQKQQIQKAADAGAVAGASAYIYGGKWKAAAQNDTAANGFANGTNGITVTVNSPPASGPNQQLGYVEVIVAQPQPTFFMRVGGFYSMPVSARAVASALGSASGCIYVMDRAAADSYKAVGGAVVTSACGIMVDSRSTTAFDQNGNGCTNATNIAIVGGVDHDSCSIPAPGDQGFATGIAPFSDPLSWLTEPEPALPCDHDHTNVHITGGTHTLSQGTYCGGIRIGGSSPSVTFSPGLYVLYGGGMTINADATVSGDGVTFYNTGAQGTYAFQSISINGVSNSSLSAPTDANNPLVGILFFEDRNAKNEINGNGTINNTINGGSGTNFEGALYFSSSSLNYSGGTTAGAYTIIVADQVTFAGNSILNDNYSSLPGGGSPIHTSFLVE